MSNNLQFNKPFDPVPESVYEKAHDVTVAAFEALGVQRDRAEKAASDCFKGVRSLPMEKIVLDGEKIDGHLVLIDIDTSNDGKPVEKDNIVTVYDGEYERTTGHSVFVCTTKTDAFLVGCTCDNYVGIGRNIDEFTNNHQYKKIQAVDIKEYIKKSLPFVERLKH